MESHSLAWFRNSLGAYVKVTAVTLASFNTNPHASEKVPLRLPVTLPHFATWLRTDFQHIQQIMLFKIATCDWNSSFCSYPLFRAHSFCQEFSQYGTILSHYFKNTSQMSNCLKRDKISMTSMSMLIFFILLALKILKECHYGLVPEHLFLGY